MKITIELDSLEELARLTERILVGGSGDNFKEIAKAEPDPAPAPKKEKASAKKAEPAPAAEPEPAADPDPEPAEPKEGIAESAVKLLLAEKIKSGKKAEIRALFEEYGVSKLSELVSKHPEKLAEFATKAEAV